MRYRVDFLSESSAPVFINADTFYTTGDMVIFSTNPTNVAFNNTLATGFHTPARQVAAFRGWQAIVEDNNYLPAQAGDTEEDI